MKIERVVVIGGGLAGLTASVLLARGGLSVALYERSTRLGGRGITKEVGGFRINMGPHSLYLEERVTTILNEIGVSYTGRSPNRDNQQLELNGRLGKLPISGPSILQNEVLTEESKKEILQLLSDIAQMDTSGWRGKSVLEWMESSSMAHPQTKLFVESALRLGTYAASPELVDTEFFLKLLTAMPEVWYLDQGWGTLIDGLEQAACEASVRILLNTKVSHIHTAENGYQISLADGSLHQTDFVIMATDPATVLKLVGEGDHQELRRWVENTIPIYAATMNVALKLLPKPENTFVLGFDTPYYYSVHSDVADLASDGGALIHIMKYLRPGEKNNAVVTREELRNWLDSLQPGWRDLVVEEQFLPKMMVAGDVIQANRGGLSGRLGPKVPGTEKLYVVGDWVGNEGQLANASFASAHRAASMILEGNLGVQG